MAGKSHIPRLSHMIQAMERIRELTAGTDIAAFEEDWQKQWLVERGMQIITEATRHLPDDLKARHTGIPWKDIWGLGNVLRHDYEGVAPKLLWKIVHEDFAALEQVCRAELEASGPDARRTEE
jgi:uncharacterized protein with HEPN domain